MSAARDLVPMAEPLGELAQRLGISASAQVPLSDGAAFMSHSAWRSGITVSRFGATKPCEGMFRFEDDAPLGKRIVRCDACGDEFAIPAGPSEHADVLAWRRRRANLPEAIADREFQPTPENRDGRKLCQSWVMDGGVPAPALWGAPGVGKTHLLARMGMALLGRGVDVLFWRSRALCDALKQQIGTDEKLWGRVLAVPVLVLDDLGAERDTDWQRDRIEAIIEERYERERPIALSSNFAPERWSDVWGARAASRLRGMTLPVRLTGPDRRQGSLGCLN